MTTILSSFENDVEVLFTFADAPTIALGIDAAPTFSLDVGTVAYAYYPAYDGAYEATPTRESQTFATANLRMTGDFTVNPIPSNYGLITYDGSTITVS